MDGYVRTGPASRKGLQMTRSLFLGLSVLVLGAFGSGCRVDAATYDECIDSSDCQGGDTCTRVITSVSDGRMCTHSCESNANCGGPAGLGGSCYMIFGDPNPDNFVCYQRCVNDFDCFSGSRCFDATMEGAVTDAVCFPVR